MREHLLSVAAFAMLAMPVLGQGVPSETVPDWPPVVMDAFFADTTAMTLRDDVTMIARFADLPEVDRQAVIDYCTESRNRTAEGSEGAAAAPAPSSDTAAEPADLPAATDLESAGTGEEGSEIAPGTISLSHTVRICSVVAPAEG